MRLRRVRIFGFKTFADKTELDFDGDLIAVVGPNGCGKSNIVDAILWGLGEPNARHLRAPTSQDVIFSGSARRKGLGYAEVTLHFENEDGGLAIDTPEVTITRRLTRAGDSEYRINREPCRQRDVYDLLADSGLGRSGYAIVGQKEIDQALAASAEDRRAWIDEAAGVQRYRQRRTESLRRLDQSETHLSRVEDLIREIEGQIGPLMREAEVAKRYKSVLASLREVESGLMIREVTVAWRELGELEGRIQEILRRSGDETDRAEALEAEMRVTGEAVSEVERELDAVRELQQQALSIAERADAALLLAQQRRVNLDDLELNLQAEGEQTGQRIAEAEADVARLRDEERTEDEALHAAEAQGQDPAEAERYRENLRATELALTQAREVATRRARMEQEAKSRAERRHLIDRELAGISATQRDTQNAMVEADAAVTDEDARLTAVGTEITDLENRIRQASAQETLLGGALRKILADVAAREGQKRGLEATLETHEGLAQGARAVLTLVEQRELEDVYMPVATAFDADLEHALAIETALGGAQHDLIVPHERDAKLAIALLKDRRLGRATFQPLTLVRSSGGLNARQWANERGMVGVASELVRCDAQHRPVAEALLGRTLVLETLDDALRIGRTSGWSRLVTLDGEVVHSGGAVSGGRTSRQPAGLLQRRAELEALEVDIAQRQREGERKQAEIDALHAGDRRVREELSTKQTSAQELRRERDEARSFAARIRHEVDDMERSARRLKHEREGILAADVPLPEVIDVATCEAARDACLREQVQHQADSEQAVLRLKELRQRRGAAQQRRAEAERRLHGATQAETQRAHRLENLDGERAKAEAAIQAAESDRTTAKARFETFGEKIEEAAGRRRELLEASFRLAEQAKEAQRSAQACADLAHQAELDRARADARRASAAQRLLEEYNLTEEAAREMAEGIEVPDDAQTLVARWRRELRAMGDVNLGAIEAYDRLFVRQEELTSQRDDLRAGRADIESAVRELDRLTRDRFRTTFDLVQVAFADTLQRMFGGGEGRLSLTDEQDLLGSGVEIEVVVPGKRRQPLGLLSGGERAMAACAFLFALLRVKPSPLVVLDEVDAPLDGRNVERFLSLLREFMGATQFVLITHNPTTIEAAPVWFGVTMQEPGVTTVVPYRSASSPAPTHAAVAMEAHVSGDAVGVSRA